MSILRLILSIAFFVACIVLVIIIAKQGSKNKGLSGALVGTANDNSESYYSKNKRHSKEGKIVTWSWILIAAFFALGMLLNFKIL